MTNPPEICPYYPMVREDIQHLENQVQELATRVAVLENVRALAWKWGAGAGAAIAAIVSVWHAIWSMI